MLSKIKGEVELLERHLSVMRVVARNGPIGIMKLEQMQYIKATPAGAVATPKAYTMLEHFDEDLEELILHLAALHEDKTISKS